MLCISLACRTLDFTSILHILLIYTFPGFHTHCCFAAFLCASPLSYSASPLSCASCALALLSCALPHILLLSCTFPHSSLLPCTSSTLAHLPHALHDIPLYPPSCCTTFLS